MNQIKKQISIILSIALVTAQLVLPYRIMAQPLPPAAPTAPSAPAPTQAPSAPTPAASAPTPPPQPTNPAVATPTTVVTTTPTPTTTSTVPTVTPAQVETTDNSQTATNTNTGSNSDNQSETTTTTETEVTTNNDADIDNDLILIGSTGGNISDKNTGDGLVITGDINAIGSVENNANQTYTSVPTCGATSCTTITNGQTSNAANSQTGADSNNSSATNNNSATTITNNNTANLDNGLIAIAETGRNSTSKNTGNGYIESGDANIGLTVVNVANTDIAGVKTSEFNVMDDTQGNIEIDFANLSATPVANLRNTSSASNSQSGSTSNNNSVVDNNTALTIVNNNDAQVVSDLVVDATTGHNMADKNTGDAIIKSGDANVVTNVVNLVNNTLTSGAEILVATVNVFGDWVGNLILKDSSNSANLANCNVDCNQNGTAANSQTGADSNNSSTVSNNKVTSLETNNTAEIGNGIILNASTGTNFADGNTLDGQIVTGDVNASASTNTVANNNIDGDTWWIVVVNEAGKWIGHIMGADDSGNIAQTGSVDLGSSNNTTGADSNNSSSITNNESTSVSQNNNANIDTNITINADTGHNTASKNTGSGSIETGDVNVASNIVNFVNNNFSGGKVILTFVNVFGSWIGDAITPNATVSGSIDDSDVPEVGGLITGGENETNVIDNSSGTDVSGYFDDEDTQSVQGDNDTYEDSEFLSTTSKVNIRRSKVLTSAQKYVPTGETSARLLAGQWLIDVDQTITVTPSPIASTDVNMGDVNNVWWRIIAGLSISLLAGISTQFRQIVGLLPRN